MRDRSEKCGSNDFIFVRMALFLVDTEVAHTLRWVDAKLSINV